MSEYQVKVRGLYIDWHTFTVEAETADEAIINGKRAWFDELGPGIHTAVFDAKIDDDD